MELTDLYNYNTLETGTMEGLETAGKLYELAKAMSAGSQTGRELDGAITTGSALKAESLEPTIKILTSRDQHIVLWKMVPKLDAFNTVEEYNQLVDYGLDIGVFNQEGETPQFTDSLYKRKSALIKYTGVSGEVTHPFTLVRLGSGIQNALAQEVQNKTQYLLRALNKALPTSNSAHIGEEFDGFFAQHFAGVGAGNLDTYFNQSCVVDARGYVMTDAHVEAATHAVVNDGFGMVSHIISNPKVFSDYATNFHESKRVLVGYQNSVVGATMGQSVDNIRTQFGLVQAQSDIFFDYKKPIAYNAAATNAKAPSKPTKDGTTPLAVNTDTKTLFGSGEGAGTYYYGVTAKNRYGESAMELLSTTGIAVATTQSVDMKFTHVDGAYAAECFVIYRTKVDPADYTSAKFYPIFTIAVSEKTAGYDGGAAGLVRDRNRFLPDTYSAVVLENSTDVWAIKQLAPIMRMDLAFTSPAYRFMILSYLTSLLYAPKKMARIVNIGTLKPA